MCGIVGIMGPLGSSEIRSIVTRMNKAIAHRGPDDEGVWAEDGFGFGMRRLSIIDLSTGHQPMWDEASGNGIVYNGEVYNYKVIRSELERSGAFFHTTSDTEVVLKGLVNEGEEAIQAWNGMFAMAYWEKERKSLTLIRDRIGIKPLYYYWDGAVFIFASEIKAILASGLFEPRINRQAVWDYLTFRYVPEPETMWDKVYKLPAAHILKKSPGGEPQLTRYWQTDVFSSQEAYSPDEKLKEFESLFLNAVEMRLLASDVPVGLFLSGGLDSSVIAAAAVELGHKHFHSFSVGFEDGGPYSELDFARAMAKHVGARYHEVVLNRRSFLELLPEAIRATDEPLADLTIVPLLALSRLARQDVKVVLSGEGSDEILAGYDLDVLMRRWKAISAIQSIPRPIVSPLLGLAGLVSKGRAARVKSVIDTPLSLVNPKLRIHMTRHFSNQEKHSLWPSFKGLDSDRIIDGLYVQSESQIPLEQLLSVYQKSWLVEDLLMKADKITMASSLELRVPFLDYRLVEWANRQPVALKVESTGNLRYTTKAILRKFARKRIPGQILTRPKRGFPVPMYEWLADESFRKWAHSTILDPRSILRDEFSEEGVAQILSLSGKGDMQAAHKTWLLLVLSIWSDQYRECYERN